MGLFFVVCTVIMAIIRTTAIKSQGLANTE